MAPQSITTASKLGLSGTEWIVTASPQFSIIGGENKSAAVQAYRSPRTNLRALVVQTDEPLCSLHIALATESNGGGDGSTQHAWHHPDDGLPHCLEHLVFLGSQNYPHKGVLDKLANRCLADGTNAWTATDHTCYTLSTAGSEGALNLLPIYADHILFPTITDSGFKTEIHHITGKGEDKGVVYCEMQGRENDEGSLVDRAAMDLLYPDTAERKSGYSAETGGKMTNLRTLTVDTIRRYHKEYYSADNCLLIFSGNVEFDDFFEKLDEVEALVLKRNVIANDDKTPAAGSRVGRPFLSTTLPSMDASTEGVFPPFDPKKCADSKPKKVTFPSEDESLGTISLAWRGPKYEEREQWNHLTLLWSYLSDSAASPLQLAFVENDNPIAGGVGPSHDIHTEGYLQLWLQEVAIERMDECIPLFHKVVAHEAGLEASNNGDLAFDIERMRTVIKRNQRRLLEMAERRPTRVIVDGVIRNFMYGPRAGEEKSDGSILTAQDEMDGLFADVDSIPYLESALVKDVSYWQDLLKDFILNRQMAAVYGVPSALRAVEIQTGDEKREHQQALDLGQERLDELSKDLKNAMEENEKDIPDEVLSSLPIPDLEKVKAIPLFNIRLSPFDDSAELAVVPESVRGFEQAETDKILDALKEGASSSSAPFYGDLTHIDSAFSFASVGVDTSSLSPAQRLYLPLLDEVLFKLPATLENGEVVSKDAFINMLQEDTVSFSSGVGLLGGSIPQMFYVSFQVENDDGKGPQKAMQWTHRVLYRTKITNESVKTAVQKLASEIPPQIRHGPSVVSTVMSECLYDSCKANVVRCNFLHQKPFLSLAQEKIAAGDTQFIDDMVNELQTLREELFQTTNMHPFVASNLRKSPDLVDTLVLHLSKSKLPDRKGRMITNVQASSVLSTATGGKGVVAGLSGIESGFLNLVLRANLQPYDTKRAALSVAIEYLTSLEGPFWVKLRGAGLTYSYSIVDSSDSGLIKFSLSKCGDTALAYEAAAKIVSDFASGSTAVSAIGLENAKASLAYSLIAGASSKLTAAINSFVCTFKGEKMDYNKMMLSEIQNVSEAAVLEAIKLYLVPIFQPDKTQLAIACPASKIDKNVDYFTSRGWEMKRVAEEHLFTAFSN